MFTILPKRSGENNKEYSYRVIKQAIMFLELKPGQVISEAELAQMLNISRTPIREVLSKLREENLVDVIPQVGTYVSKINLQLIEEATFMRYVLEKEVLKKACSQFPEANIIELKNNVAIQELLLGQPDKVREFHRLDNEFHLLIFQGVKKENIWNAITRLSTHYNRIRILSEIEHSFDVAIKEHKEIVKVLENGSVDKVESAVKQHIVKPMKDWEFLYKPDSLYADYFEKVNIQMPVFQ